MQSDTCTCNGCICTYIHLYMHAPCKRVSENESEKRSEMASDKHAVSMKPNRSARWLFGCMENFLLNCMHCTECLSLFLFFSFLSLSRALSLPLAIHCSLIKFLFRIAMRVCLRTLSALCAALFYSKNYFAFFFSRSLSFDFLTLAFVDTNHIFL